MAGEEGSESEELQQAVRIGDTVLLSEARSGSVAAYMLSEVSR